MLQDIETRAIAALPGLDWELADNLASRLNRDLATLTDLAAAYKQAHWNVLGPGFAELHRLFNRTLWMIPALGQWPDRAYRVDAGRRSNSDVCCRLSSRPAVERLGRASDSALPCRSGIADASAARAGRGLGPEPSRPPEWLNTHRSWLEQVVASALQ
jgi:hypothetical protein